MNKWLHQILENTQSTDNQNHQKVVSEVLKVCESGESIKITLPPTYWLECYQKTYGEIRAYETEDEARIQAKREILYAYVLRTYPDICRVFESLIKTTME